MTVTDEHERPLRADAERNRLRVLAAAQTVFAERGLDVSLDEIAAAAGVGVGTVYRRFPTKEALVDALFESRIATVIAHFERCLANPDPWDGFAELIGGACRMQAEDRGLKQALLEQHRGLERVRAARDRIAPIARQVVRRAVDAGAVRADIESFDIPMINLAVGLVAERTRDVAPDAWERILTIVLDGLRAGRAAPTPMPAPALDAEQFAAAMSKPRC